MAFHTEINSFQWSLWFIINISIKCQVFGRWEPGCFATILFLGRLFYCQGGGSQTLGSLNGSSMIKAFCLFVCFICFSQRFLALPNSPEWETKRNQNLEKHKRDSFYLSLLNHIVLYETFNLVQCIFISLLIIQTQFSCLVIVQEILKQFNKCTLNQVNARVNCSLLSSLSLRNDTKCMIFLKKQQQPSIVKLKIC